MNYTQNEKIEQVTESTLLRGVDIGSSEHYVRTLDYRGRELTRKKKLRKIIYQVVLPLIRSNREVRSIYDCYKKRIKNPLKD